MKKLSRSLIAVTVAIVILSSLFSAVFTSSAATLVYSKTANSGTRDDVCTTLEGTSVASYYTGNYSYDKLAAMDSASLFTSLQKLMRTTHTYISSYNDCHYKADKTDCEKENGKVTLIYTGYQATMSQWNGWNREHVWPKSLGGNNTNGGGADLHHIRPSDSGVNSSRGNKKYGEVGNNASSKYGTDPAVGYLGGTYNSTYFEPNDNVKGDVARICLYVYVRWNSQWGADAITEVFQSISVLLEWCALDPVDTWEMGRNEVIANIQGNRNVFIDYPELAFKLFNETAPEDMITPSGNTGSSVTPSVTTVKPATTTTLPSAITTTVKPSVSPDEPILAKTIASGSLSLYPIYKKSGDSATLTLVYAAEKTLLDSLLDENGEGITLSVAVLMPGFSNTQRYPMTALSQGSSITLADITFSTPASCTLFGIEIGNLNAATVSGARVSLLDKNGSILSEFTLSFS